MIDDTREDPVCRVTPAQLASSIDKISKHTTSRHLAQSWARRLRFLTFDDDAASEIVPTVSHEKRLLCGGCESGQRIPPGHHCYSHEQSLRTANLESETIAATANACRHITHLACSYCRTIPLFPTRKKATRFRIRRVVQKDADMGMGTFDPKSYREFPCGHFVAVSYCWSSQPPASDSDGDVDAGPYMVVEEDGSVREARASKHTIDRAVAFAAQNGYRMIWIDQECIPQDDPAEKEVGIQAMDIVYLSAHITIGLFETTLEQRHMDALFGTTTARHVAEALSLVPRGKLPAARRQPQVLEFGNVAETLELVVGDRWNTRAWILQEAFASAGSIVMLLPKSNRVRVHDFGLLCHEKAPSSEICVDFHVLFTCLKLAANIIERARPDGNTLAQTLHKVSWLHPEFPRVSMVEWSIGGSKQRDTCSAATALAFLRYRENTVVSDRLAIIANMCGYEKRLDTVGLGNSGNVSSLAVCVLALSIMNGDFSLLTPELHYRELCAPLPAEAGDGTAGLMQWALQNMPWVSDRHLSPRGPDIGHSAAESFFLRGDTLRLPGLLWKVVKFCKLEEVKKKYKANWQSLNSDLGHIMATIAREDEKRATGRGKNPFDTVSALFTHMKRRKRAITQILFDVLEVLRARGEIGVADAIWQSVWNPEWMNARKTFRPLYSIRDFPKGLGVENRGSMFRLNQDTQSSYQEEWLIDRIMKHGGFWAATLVRESGDSEYVDNRSTDAIPGHKYCPEYMNDLFDEAHGVNFDRVDDDGGDDKSSDIDETVSPEEVKETEEELELSALLDDHLKRGMVASATRILQDMFVSLIAPYPTGDSGITVDMNSMTAASQWMYYINAFGKNGLGRLKTLEGQCAIFDVDNAGEDGPASLILTPFHTHVERVPAPMTRGMGISWAVEPVEDKKDNSKYETLRLMEQCFTRGMWRVMVFPGGRYTIV